MGAFKKTAGGSYVSTSIWEKSVRVQRWYALNPQFAYSLIIDSFKSQRTKECRLEADLDGEDFTSEAYGCSWRTATVVDAKRDARADLLRWLADRGAYCANVVGPDDYS